MRAAVLLPLLAACGDPALQARVTDLEAQVARAPGPVSTASLRAWIDADDVAVDGEVLRFVHTGPAGPVEVRVHAAAEDQLVFLSTGDLITLRDTAGERGIVLLLTQMATSNYELDDGKLQLNPATGGVTLSIELETDDGLGETTFRNALARLTEAADTVLPTLRTAAQAPRL
ncbi:MAG: hypothetical protein H6733_11270 [Alphaproteobacteria bacterium]|nr:hypothetical protein [Alphaproteobacteria bacterium]